jgi:tRNA (guanine-N(7)-)-methyltransferase subunit TRM82
MDESEGPPGKRVKLSPSKEQKPNFSTLILSRNGQYLVAVTGEDKCVRVFETDSHGRLHQLSER